MISFDTFTGAAHGAIDEQRDGTMKDEEPAKRRASRRSHRRRSRRTSSADDATTAAAALFAVGGTDDEADFSNDDTTDANGSANAPPSGVGDGRVHHLFQLLSLKNHTGDAKRALVQRLLGVDNVSELVLSKATEEQIASAANDAITDEILATVDQEDKRRQSESGPIDLFHEAPTTASATITSLVVGHPVESGPYRVLELVDVLDSTTGGMVKRILTNVRRRAPGTQRGGGGSWHRSEFCGFCVDYRTHSTAQHKCRICGALGVHRSHFCTQSKAAPTPASSSSASSSDSTSHSHSHSRPPTPRSRRRRTPMNHSTAGSQGDASSDEPPPADTASRLTPDASDTSFCAFCSTWGFHSTENHRCRICGVTGEHRSRHCTSKSASDGYRWRGSPAADGSMDRKFCELCGSLRNHSTEEHRCRICLKLGEHRSKTCPMHTPTPPPSAAASTGDAARPTASPEPLRAASRGGRLTPRLGGASVRTFCSYCAKQVAHKSEEHICRICRATGLHRSGDCPARATSSRPPSSSSSVLSYSVETASKVRDRVLESIPLVLPASATTLVMDSIDKVGDVDTILRRTLQRIGVWGGGSQTPITTPYAAPAAPSSSSAASLLLRSSRQSFVDASVPPPALQDVDGSGVYVVSYAEGRSVVPERILKYMRLLMHHEISTNAFSVVVVFDPRPSTWELEKPGMVTPRSLPSSPTMSEQLKKRMAKYTLQTLLSTRDKLVKLVVAQKKLQLAQQQQQYQRVPPSIPVIPNAQAAS